MADRTDKKLKCVLNGEESLSSLANTDAINYLDKKEFLKEAEKIDKIDMFDHRMICDDDYLQSEYVFNGKTTPIGIKLDPSIHYSGSPILPHQAVAVEKFLGDFRGIGILADEVGMGKTVEAGMIISELAERNLARSILIIAASEDNLNDWIKTLGDMFGLYGIAIAKNSKDIRLNCTNLIPNCPIIITFDNFCEIHKEEISNILFDIIALDEAHNLDGTERGKSGMECLRTLMETKKKRNKPYCILISGTPHKGNLDSMFPLWYFIKGGADEKSARKHYKEFLCHGASTVAEFIESFKISELKDNEKFIKYMNEQRERLSIEKGIVTDLEFGMYEYSLRKEFLEKPENSLLAERIRKITKKAYNDLLSGFMIRQSRAKNLGKHVIKKAVNYYFLPVTNFENKQKAVFENYTHPDFRISKCDFELDCNDIYGENAVLYEGNRMSLDNFLGKAVLPNILNEKSDLFNIKKQILFEAFEQLGCFVDKFENGYRRRVDDAYYFKGTGFNRYKNNVTDYYELTDGKGDDIFIDKAEKFIEIVNSPIRKNKKIVVFFDYYSYEKANEAEKLYEYIKEKAPEIFKRIIYNINDDIAAEIFEGNTNKNINTEKSQREQGILFATEKLSESSNFQFCDTVINFSICSSPIKMDQRIGRIDRIGQENNMEIISFAAMDRLEGYLLVFFNQIQLFSGWKDDIILVTGCDNKNMTTMRCVECEKIIRSYDGNTNCPSCASKNSLKPLLNCLSYKCPVCGKKFMRTQTGTKKEGYGYVCDRNKKLYSPNLNSAKEKPVYICEKTCSLLHCRRADTVRCAVTQLLRKDPYKDFNELRRLCKNCKDKICDTCDLSIDTRGISMISGQKIGDSCLNCPSKNSMCNMIVDFENVKCMNCSSSMEPIVPSTFDEFAEFIWNESTFTSDFLFESNKISEIVKVLRND